MEANLNQRHFKFLENEIPHLMSALFEAEEASLIAHTSELHSKKSDICVLKFYQQSHVKKLNSGSLKASDFEEDTLLIDTVINDLRKISYNLYPKIISHVGLLKYLRQYLDDFAENNGFKIEIIISGDDIKFPENLEVGIFKLCREILQYFMILGDPEILIEIFEEDQLNFFVFSIKDIPYKKSDVRQKKINLVKARLFYLGAHVSIQTNWLYFFKFGFK